MVSAVINLNLVVTNRKLIEEFLNYLLLWCRQTIDI